MASATGVQAENPVRDEEQPLLGRPGDATQLVDQPIYFNLITGTAVIAQIGVVILVALVWAKVFMQDIMLFSGHPLANSLAILFFVEAALILQPTATAKQKEIGAIWHSTFNTFALGSLLAGVVIIEINKGNHARFTSIHGRLGLATIITIVLQYIVGFTQFWTPQLYGGVDNAKAMYKYHRMSGYVVAILALATVCAATQTAFIKNVVGIKLWPVIVASVLILLGVVPRIKLHKFGYKRNKDS